MEFVITEYKHCDLIQISGRVDSYTSPQINNALNALMADEHYKFVVDMQNVTYLSSSGILTFVNAQKKCKRYNRGEIVLTNVSKVILSTFQLAGFDRLFDFYDDVVSAVGKF
jgi:anti-sigma B factor antagonist